MSNPSASNRPRDGIGFDAGHSAGARPSPLLAREQGCSNGSPEQAELASIVSAIEAYEEKRWPLGKVPGGKG